MKNLLVALSFAVLCAGLAPVTADAKRIGGGGSAGMQRSIPPRAPAPATPAKPAQAAPVAPATAAAPAAAPKRSWMGPLAGLAAGLGIAALMSHFGMGAELGSMVTMLLFAVAAFFVIRFVMARLSRGAAGPSMATPNGAGFAGMPQPVASGSGWGAPVRNEPTLPAVAHLATTAATTAASTPAGFDTAAFERIAKLIFIRMQAANDGADLNDLRNFTTPEMFASIKLDLQERGSATQTTDVVQIDAEVLDVESDAARQVVSVRFHGLIREEKDGVANPFDEVWHLVKPTDGSREWAIAGIQQPA